MHRHTALAMAGLLVLGAAPGVAGQEGDTSDRPPIPSAGCGASIVDSGTFLDQSMDVVGFTRRWGAYVPQVHGGETPVPVWLYLHPSGGNRNSAVQALQPVADELGFLALTPQARGGGWLMASDDTEPDVSMENPDAVFLDQVLNQVGDELCVDLARVYVVGNSIGAMGASIAACIWSDRIAAIAPVAGVIDVGDPCRTDRAMPTMAIHGTADGIAPFAGGLEGETRVMSPVKQALLAPSVPDRVAAIAARNGCEPGPLVEAISDRVEARSWRCPSGAEVELVVHDGGHGIGPVGYETIQAFFEQHPLPE
jgi:polyhydroxybutyrate depolymerase